MQPIGRMTLEPLPGELLRRGRAGRVPRRSPRARHRGRRRSADAGALVQLPRHAADAARRAELLADPDQPAASRRSTTTSATASISRPCTTAGRRTCPTPSAAVARSSPAPRTAATSTCPRMVEGAKVRERGPDDEYAQATLFWNSMTEIEQDHIVDAYTFELGKVEVPAVVERMVTRLALVDAGPRPAGLRRPRSAGTDACRRPLRPTAVERRPIATTTAGARRHRRPRRVAGAGDGHRQRLPGRRPRRADPRQRRLRPRRHPSAAGGAPRGRCRAARDRHPQGRDRGPGPTGRRADRRPVVPHGQLGRGRRDRRRRRRRPRRRTRR